MNSFKGGAENLIVNAAIALLDKGHQVVIYTAHHDTSHCFEETKGIFQFLKHVDSMIVASGRLGKCIIVRGDWLPKSIGLKMYAFCAMVRMVYLGLVVLLREREADVYIVDQVSLPVVLLKWSGNPVLFYCHFPDQLLCTERDFWLKRAYRYPVDVLEEYTTCNADCIVVNSLFTASVCKDTFKSMRNRDLAVLYPPVDVKGMVDGFPEKNSKELMFVSLNRYERKKNIQLAIDAMVALKDKIPKQVFEKAKLIVAGGYDPNNKENEEYFNELTRHVGDIQHQIVFLKSISKDKKLELLVNATCVLYTPTNEHFGIVPVEAMCAKTPVIAVNSGGPKESLLDQVTGFLCDSNPNAFADAMKKIAMDNEMATKMGQAGQKRVFELFSMEAFGNGLHDHVVNMYNGSRKASRKSKQI